MALDSAPTTGMTGILTSGSHSGRDSIDRKAD